jgi:hypothetical protein
MGRIWAWIGEGDESSFPFPGKREDVQRDGAEI